jgi:uncharacterized membrane protein YgcG
MTHYYNRPNAVSRSGLVTLLDVEPLTHLQDYEANARVLAHDEILRFLAQRYWDTTTPFKALAELRTLRMLRNETVVEFTVRFLGLATSATVAAQPWVVQEYCKAVGPAYTDLVRDHTVFHQGLLPVMQAVAAAWTSRVVAHGYTSTSLPSASNGPTPMELGAVSAEQRSLGHWARDCAAEPVSTGRGRQSGSRQSGRSRDSSRDSRGSAGSGGYDVLQNYKPRSYGGGSRGGGGRARSPAAR